MPLLFVYLIKVNLALLIFCAGYYLVLRQLTFYTLNRIYLVAAILFASIYPKINLSAFFARHQTIASPVQAIVYRLQAPAKELIRPLAKPDYWQLAGIVFWVGAAVFAFRLLIQFISLFRIYRKSKAGEINGHDVRLIDGYSGPFSFWKNIYINPEMHEGTDLTSILLHEQVHVNELHTLDILLAEFSAIFYWFNPGIWLMKKAIRENIEFITDRKILNKGIDTKQYQYSLVNVSFSAAPQGIVNHFNISTIKKRIIMMNAKRSSKLNLTRYAFLVPAVVALLLIFSVSKAALIKKSHFIHQAVAVEIKTAINQYHNAVAVVKKTMIPAKTKSSGDVTVPAGKISDTVKNGNVTISTNPHTDSLKYMINGVKSTKADFKNLDPDHILSLDILSAELANTVLNETDNKHDVMFITTDDSKEGKKLKEKIDELIHHSIIAGTGSIAVTRSSRDSKESATNVASGTSNTSLADVIIVDASPKLYKIRPKKSMSLSLKADTLKLTTRNVQLAAPDTIKVLNMTLDKGPYKIASKEKFQDRISLSNGMTYKQATKINPKYTTKNFRIYSDIENETNIEHLSAKLIMIDGKEANEHDLKKLSAAAIESMSVKSGEEMTKKYGDKAKNGVLFITTKK